MSEETKQKISKRKKNHPGYNNEWKSKISKGNKGKICSEITKEKMRKPHIEGTGDKISKTLKERNHSKYFTEEVRKKMSTPQKGRPKPFNFIKNLTENNKKHILQYDLDGNFIKEWSSIKEAGLSLNKRGAAIGECCQEKRKTAYKYIWKFKINQSEL
jgi:hypothetical protein